MSRPKIAVLSMDIEDWYHTEYLKGSDCDRSYTMLDGVNNFAEICGNERVAASFFVLGELVRPLGSQLRMLAGLGHDIASHGWCHQRPLTMLPTSFGEELRRCRDEMRDVLGKHIAGFRASCFSLDSERLDIVKEAGFLYDSSRVQVRHHPLYGTLDMDGFESLSPHVFRKGDFFEFEISTLPLGRRNFPVAGGAYLRVFPWPMMKRLIRRYLQRNELYVLYIHPFEVSRRSNPVYPEGTRILQKARFEIGRASVEDKLRRLIFLLKQQGFEFATFANLRERLLIGDVTTSGGTRAAVAGDSCGYHSIN